MVAKGRAPRREVTGAARAARLALLVVLLYAFLVGVDLLGSGIAGLG